MYMSRFKQNFPAPYVLVMALMVWSFSVIFYDTVSKRQELAEQEKAAPQNTTKEKTTGTKTIEKKVIEKKAIEKKESSAEAKGLSEEDRALEKAYAKGGYAHDPDALMLQCLKDQQKLPGKFSLDDLTQVCSEVKKIEGCESHAGQDIYHFERLGVHRSGKRVLALSLIHGDEVPGGSIARSWMERLARIEPRNSWRIVPILNPDGWHKLTRTNGRGVDLNRNFPSRDWTQDALSFWEKRAKKSARRYPGEQPASEKETRCAIKHIRQFKPDLIIAIHTPLGLLDFDGPKLNFPKFDRLPWTHLGTFPGSLGRYMWHDNKVPVMTVELKGNDPVVHLEKFDRLQDISGTVAIMSEKEI